MDAFVQDLRHAARRLRRSPGFALIAILTLALGIGANTAIFSVVNAVLLRSLPFEDPGRVVAVPTVTSRGGGGPHSSLDFLDLREQTRSFTAIAGTDGTLLTLSGGEEPERIRGARVSANFFDLLGARPLAGRYFRPGEDEPGQSRVAVISHGLWQRRFGGDPRTLGRELRVDGESHSVVGIAPPELDFPSEAEVWIPLTMNGDFLRPEARGNHFMEVYGRLKDGVGAEQATADVAAVMRRLAEQYPETNAGFGAEVVPLRDQLLGDVRPALLVLLGAVALVLLIACANLSNLLLARAVTREGEVSLRMALGSSRKRIVRQLLVESGVLAVFGGVAGLALGAWGLEVLTRFGTRDIPRLDQVSVDLTVLGFTLVVTLLTAVLFGLLPALQASRIDLARTLRDAGRSGRTLARGRTRHLLVVSETALAVMLLVGAGLLLRSFLELQRVDPGFRAENVLALEVSLPETTYPWGAPGTLAFHEQALERLRGLPGVRSAASAFLLPLSGGMMMSSMVDQGKAAPAPGEQPLAIIRIVTPGYFETLGVPLRSGRLLEESDRGAAGRAVVVSEEAVRRYWPGEDPIGRTVEIGVTLDEEAGPIGGTIVGVVGSVRHQGVATEPFPEVYVPMAQGPTGVASFLVRTAGDPMDVAAAATREIRALDADVPVSRVRTVATMLSEAVAQPRFYTLLIGVFAALALLLAGVGIYGVVSGTVAHRSQEFGIRMALGADPGKVVGLVLRQYLTLVGVGLVLGVGLALAGGRVLASLLYGVDATDPVTFVGVAAVLGLTALLASWVPAWRATRVDPLVAMKQE